MPILINQDQDLGGGVILLKITQNSDKSWFWTWFKWYITSFYFYFYYCDKGVIHGESRTPHSLNHQK